MEISLRQSGVSIESSPSSCREPIFLLGISERSGTNYLADLIRIHPGCAAPAPIWEDFLLYNSDYLVSFATSVPNRWNAAWGVRGIGLEDSLYRCIGDGLLNFLNSRTNGKRLFTKTPNVRNLSNFFKLFPDAYLLILVRDGRAVVESQIKSFGGGYELAMRKWAGAAAAILKFLENTKNKDFKFRVIRYEDLCSHLDKQLPEILEFLGISTESYDFDAAFHLPVRGSSVLRGQKTSVHWKPVEKTQDFNPLQRWQNWSRSRHERFNWIAGQYLDQFDYPRREYTSFRWLWAIWNVTLDLQWHMKWTLQVGFYELKKIGEAIKRHFT